MRLYNEDCFAVLPRLKAQSVNLVLCDPPYKKTALWWDAQLLDLDTLWKEYARICKGPVIFMAAQPFTTTLINSNSRDFRYVLIWDKGKGSNPLLANKQPLQSHEDIVVFYKKQPIYNPQMKVGTPYKPPRTGGNRTNSIVGATADRVGFRQATKDTSKRFPTSILKHSIHCGSKLQPTQKPVALMEELICTYTNKGMTVLDNCMGSGTTGIACLNTGRKFIGIEKDAHHFLIAQERLHCHLK